MKKELTPPTAGSDELPVKPKQTTHPNLKYPWQQALRDALAELRPEYLPTKISAAECAISARLRDPHVADLDERIALHEALQSIVMLFSEKEAGMTVRREEANQLKSLDLLQVNRVRVETLFIDLQLAHTFTDVAESSAGEKRERNLANARRAFFMIREKLLPLCTLTDAERNQVEQMLRQLGRRLEESDKER